MKQNRFHTKTAESELEVTVYFYVSVPLSLPRRCLQPESNPQSSAQKAITQSQPHYPKVDLTFPFPSTDAVDLDQNRTLIRTKERKQHAIYWAPPRLTDIGQFAF